jgi:cysteine synthase
VNLYVKVEAFNLLGSVKDRLPLGAIEEAERTDPLFFCPITQGSRVFR